MLVVVRGWRVFVEVVIAGDVLGWDRWRLVNCWLDSRGLVWLILVLLSEEDAAESIDI